MELFNKIKGAMKEGGDRARASHKTTSQKLEIMRKKRKGLDAHNQLNRDYKQEKSSYREAKLESYGLGLAKRKKFAATVKKFADGNAKKFKKGRKGRGGSSQFKTVDIW